MVLCFFVWKIVCRPSRMVGASGWSRSRGLGAGWWRRKEELVELAFLASFGSEHGDTLDSPARSLCRDRGEWEAPGRCWFGGDGIQLVALVAQMYWFVVQLVRLRKPVGRTLRFCLFKRCTARVRVAALTLKSHDSEVCAAEQRCACRWSHLVHLLLITVSVQGDECRNTPRGLLTHTALPGSDGGPVMCYCLGGKRSYDLLTAKVSLRKTKQQDLSL